MYSNLYYIGKNLFDCMNLNIDDTHEDYIRIKSEQAVTQEEFAGTQIVSTAPHGTRGDVSFTPLQPNTETIQDLFD